MVALDWAEKYRPHTLSQIAGNNKALEELKLWAKSWETGIPKEKVVVLYGRAGIGKTTAAHALAQDMGWEVVEMNASDQRTAEIIEKVAGSASQMRTLEGGRRLVIMDEADNIHGNADRGGEKAIVELIKKTSHPIILIANEFYDMSAGLRSACKPIQFTAASRSIIPVLKRIAEAEGVKIELGVFERLAENANGDIRSAVNDLQAIAQGKSRLDISDISTAERDIKENIFKVLVKVFKGKNIIEAHKATFNLDENPEDFIQWVDENLPLEYVNANDLEEGYHYISRASVFLGRVARRQNYNMWRYAGVMMTAGIVVARSQSYRGFVKYQSPSLWRKLGSTKGSRSIRDSTSKKIGTHCHVSMRFVRSHLLPFFRMMLKDEGYAPKVAAILALEPEEIAFLAESKSVTKKIQKIYEEARSLVEKETEHEIELFGGFGVQEEEQEETEIAVVKKPQSSLFDF